MLLHYLSENYSQIMSKKASKSTKNGAREEKTRTPDDGVGDLNVIHNVFAGWNLANKLLERINNNDHIKNLDNQLEEEENGIDYRKNKVDQISDRKEFKILTKETIEIEEPKPTKSPEITTKQKTLSRHVALFQK
uniref:Uncharacterized protein n=1 Tax=Romanomermis culicivorax TaxID=13658 RepID=A0A915KZD4_ROMCU